MSACRSGTQPSGWAVAATVTAVLFLVYVLRLELLPLAFAAALAYLLDPVVGLLRNRLHLPRRAAVLLVYLTVLAFFGLAAWWCYVSARQEAAGTFGHLPDLLTAQVRRLAGPRIDVFGQSETADEVVQRALNGAEAWVAQPSPLLLAGSIVVAGPTTLVLVFVVLFYCLNSGRQLAEGVLWLAPPAIRPRLRGYWRRIDPMLRHYVRGVLLVVLYTSGTAWLVLQFAFHAVFAVPTAGIVGVLELVPVVGPAVSMVLLGTVGLLRGGGAIQFVLMMVFAVALRVSIDEVVGPLVLGRAVTLHPVAIIVSFLLAGSLFGVLGVLFAVPVAAAIKIVLQVVYDEESAQ